MMHILKNKWALTSLLLIAGTAFAEQRISADERTPQTVSISKKDMSRIAIDGGRIKNVKYLDGELEIDKENSTGQVFVRALTDRSTSLFVNSEDGKTYLLILKPVAKRSDSIIIDVRSKEEAQLRKLAERPVEPPPPQAVTTKSTDYVRGIKQLMLAMMNGTAASMNLQSKASYQTVSLWKNVQFVQTMQYTAADMKASTYTLTNLGTENITLREQEFFKPDVYAVSIRRHNLRPGEMTEVYIIQKLGAQ